MTTHAGIIQSVTHGPRGWSAIQLDTGRRFLVSDRLVLQMASEYVKVEAKVRVDYTSETDQSGFEYELAHWVHDTSVELPDLWPKEISEMIKRYS